MVNPKKQDIVKSLSEKLAQAKSLVLVDYTGLTVPQQEKLRSQVKQKGGEFTITKNTLLKLAIKEVKGLPSGLAESETLKGPTATLFSYQDELAPIKALVKFSEEFEILPVKLGLFEGKIIDKETVLDLAKIPGREELLTKLIYLLQSPISGLSQVLSTDIRKLILILANIKKEGGEN